MISEYITYISFNTAGITLPINLEIFILLIGIFLPTIFIITTFYSYKHYSPINSILNKIGAVWLSIVFYLLMASFIVFILIMSNYYLNSNIPTAIISFITISLSLLLIIYGVWNSYHIVIKTYNTNSDDLSKYWSNKKIVIVSDIHIGNITNEKRLKKVIDLINDQKPDITFFLGDLIEGTSFPYEKWLASFENLNPPLGNYYVEGNHEKYSQEYELFRSKFPKNLIDLTDKKITINNTEIIGISYKKFEFKKETALRYSALNPNKKMPNIILIHDPRNTKILAKTGASLVLSGHTHGGQFFPITLFVNLIYKKYTYGLHKKDTTTHITSSGAGSSMIPLRIGTTPEIIVLTIK